MRSIELQAKLRFAQCNQIVVDAGGSSSAELFLGVGAGGHAIADEAAVDRGFDVVRRVADQAGGG